MAVPRIIQELLGPCCHFNAFWCIRHKAKGSLEVLLIQRLGGQSFDTNHVKAGVQSLPLPRLCAILARGGDTLPGAIEHLLCEVRGCYFFN